MRRGSTTWSVLAAIAAVVVAVVMLAWPRGDTIGDDFRYDARIISINNFYDEDLHDFAGDILSKTRFACEVVERQDDHAIIKNVFDVRTPSGKPIHSVERLYGIDPHTGAHIPGFGDKDRTGFLFAPARVGVDDFTYWHVNYDTLAHMRFAAKEDILGLRVHRFECRFIADQTADLGHLPGVPEERGVELDVLLELWIEPRTGHLIKYEDHATAWYYDMRTKERIHPWNRFQNTFENVSVAETVERTVLHLRNQRLYRAYLPAGLVGLAIILLLFGYRPGKRGPARTYLSVAVIIVFGAVITIAVWRFADNAMQLRREAEFSAKVQDVQQLLAMELGASTEVVYALRASWVSSGMISGEAFSRLAGELRTRRPSLKALTWVPMVGASERDGSIARTTTRSPGSWIREKRGAELVPAGEREVYYPIMFIEPTAGNEAAIGFDLGSEPRRLRALNRAQATGEVCATEGVFLVQDTAQENSFILVLPVEFPQGPGYSKGTLAGFICAMYNMKVFVGNAIMGNASAEDLILRISDPDAQGGTQVLYGAGAPAGEPRSTKTITLRIGGRIWQVDFASRPDRDDDRGASSRNVILGIGLLLTLLSSFTAYRFLTDNRKELAASEGRFRGLLESAPDAIIIADSEGRMVLVNSRTEELFGHARQDLLGRSIEILIPQRHRETPMSLS